uniref:O-antigen ligase-related domain-containing protein n=1 Tax=Ammonifex degensii TaxID=42838 RepID=A0A7C1JNK0_9THEO
MTLSKSAAPGFRAHTALGEKSLKLFPPTWEAYIIFLTLPGWWLLGMDQLIWPFAALVLLPRMLAQGRIVFPRSFYLWLLFLCWFFLSGTQVEGENRWLAYFREFTLYFSASCLFLYIFNYGWRSRWVPYKCLSISSVYVAVAGIAGFFLPQFSLPTAAEAILPASLVSDPYVYPMVHKWLAEYASFMGEPFLRPKGLMMYAAEMAVFLAITAPVNLHLLLHSPDRRWKAIALIALGLAVWPLIFSVGRSGWLGLTVGLAFLCVRLLSTAHKRLAIKFTIVMLLLCAGVYFLTPAPAVVKDRLAHPHSNQARMEIYTETLLKLSQSPWLGFGTQRPAEKPGLPPLGSHQTYLGIAFRHGWPGLLLFLLWMGTTLRLAFRAPTASGPFLTASLLAILVGMIGVSWTVDAILLHTIWLVLAVIYLESRQITWSNKSGEGKYALQSS